jgi:alpha-galactosidase
MVQTFRREESPYESARIPLRALNPDAHYRVTNVDQPDKPLELTGKELLEKGLPISIPEKPGTAFFLYERV